MSKSKATSKTRIKKLLKECEALMDAGRLQEVLDQVRQHPELKTAVHQDTHLLHLASIYRTGLEFHEELLKLGVDPNLEDTAGHTPLIDASDGGNLKMTALLLKYGAQVNHQNLLQETAFSFACARNQLRIAKLLYQHGADPNMDLGSPGMRPIDWADRFASKTFMKWLKSVSAPSR